MVLASVLRYGQPYPVSALWRDYEGGVTTPSRSERDGRLEASATSAPAMIAASAPTWAAADSSVPTGIVRSDATAAASRIALRGTPRVRLKPTSQATNSAAPEASSSAIQASSGSYGSPIAFFSPAATATTPRISP